MTGRTRQRLPAQTPVLLVLGVVAVALLRTLTQHWREGAALLALALLLAAGLRVVLSTERAGLLAIRGRVVDVACYGAFAAVLGGLAATITANPLIAR